MEHTLSTSFQLKRSKMNKKGQVPINLRVTINGKRIELSTNRMIFPDMWSNVSNAPKGKSEEAQVLNNYLHSLVSKVQKQYNIMESLGQEITADAIGNAMKGTSEKKLTLLEVFNFHNEQFLSRVDVDYTMSSYKLYIYALEKLKSFLVYHYRKSDILLEDLNHRFVTSFELYLKTHDSCSHNTTMKYIKRLKKIINFALSNDWIQSNPFIRFTCSYKEVPKDFLNAEELLMLIEKEIRIKRLDNVRDVFVFCCYTGLAYADVEKLSSDDLQMGIDGEKWIIINRKKTDGRSPIPLLPQALAIVNKYKNDPVALAKGTLLPVNSNQRMNGYLKEIADITGITVSAPPTPVYQRKFLSIR